MAAVSAALAVWAFLGGRLPAIRVPAVALPPGRDIAVAGLSGAALSAAVFVLSGVAVVSAVLGLLVAATVLASKHIARERSRAALVVAWPDFLATLQSRLAAGYPLPDACVGAAMSSPVTEPFGRGLEVALRQGVPFQVALGRERAHLADPMADRVLVALAGASHTGGGRVAEVLGLLGRSVADELRVRRAHDAALTQQRLTAAVALGAPWALLLLTVATNPHAANSYGTAGGARVVAAGLVMTVVGFILARRSARLSKPRRIFR